MAADSSAAEDWMYSGEIWHPMLMDLSIFVLTVSGSLWILASW